MSHQIYFSCAPGQIYWFLVSGKYPRDTYGDHFQRQNDQQIVVNDSFERMSGYRYFGVFDFDEFLTLAEGANIKEMMVYNFDLTLIFFLFSYFLYFLLVG